MARINIYTQQITVGQDDIDMQHRVSNLRYMAWMQDVAVAHSAVCGWPMERYDSIGQGWVVRQHTITYKRPAFLGDVITAATWIASYASRRSLRRYAFWNAKEKALLAEAETQWVFIDMTSGKPVSVPGELQESFPIVDEDAPGVFRRLCV
ncbi:acyl-CoA thioesterase [Desulfovibrio desulfuricans]|uniref:acyl-CoA thioesterase n=1 Tax=Desulfovibrio desulfuricans TaxID=876 RepID=UPI0003B77D75|nr:acyl-CoA thioesterase [Desulfovibrio desulfuricans]